MMSNLVAYSALGAFSPSDEVAMTARIDFLHELGSFRARILGIGERDALQDLYASTLLGQALPTSHTESYAILREDKVVAAMGYCYVFFDNMWREVTFQPRSSFNIASGWLLVSAEKLSANEATKLSRLIAENPIPEKAARLIGEEEKIPIALAAIRGRIPVDRLKGVKAMWCTTDKGIVRGNNEDGVSCASIRISDRGLSRSYRLLAVADGAGGHGHGEIASLETLNEVIYRTGEMILQQGGLRNEEMLSEIVYLANSRVIQARRIKMSNMASTLTMILVADNTVYTAHVGDSRAYYIKENTIMQLTEDHKYVEELVKKGAITRQQAKTHPQRNIITSALGMPQPRVDVTHHPIVYTSGARLLVCSDGLSDLLEDGEIHRIVMGALAPTQAAAQLVNAANRKGGYDNVSVALDFFL